MQPDNIKILSYQAGYSTIICSLITTEMCLGVFLNEYWRATGTNEAQRKTNW